MKPGSRSLPFLADFNVGLTLVLRELLKLQSERARIFGLVVQPLLFWVVFSFGFDNGFGSQSAIEFKQYFLPGVFVMTVLFGCVFSSMTIIDDRNQGFLQAALVTPAHRLSVILGKSFGVIAITLLQVAFVALVAAFSTSEIGAWRPLELFLWAILSCFALVPFNLGAALFLNSSQGYHAFMGVVLFPLWALSGAIFPLSGEIFEAVAMLNPLTYMVEGFRRGTGLGDAVSFDVLFSQILLLILCGVFGLFFALYALRRSSQAL